MFKSIGLYNQSETHKKIQYPVKYIRYSIVNLAQLSVQTQAYIHYPFGSLKPGRYLSDTTDNCVTLNQTVFVVKEKDTTVWEPTLGGNGGFSVSVLQTLNSPRQVVILSAILDGIAIDIEDTATSGILVVVEKELEVAAKRIVPSTGNIKLRLSTIPMQVGNRSTATGRWITKKTKYLEQQNIAVTLCDSTADRYRFGFNGQEKVNEIGGIGNHNTAEFWEYDTRLGRRWNLDPVDQVSISNYAAFRNNPIVFNDVLGDVPSVGKESISVTNNGSTDKIQSTQTSTSRNNGGNYQDGSAEYNKAYQTLNKEFSQGRGGVMYPNSNPVDDKPAYMRVEGSTTTVVNTSTTQNFDGGGNPIGNAINSQTITTTTQQNAVWFNKNGERIFTSSYNYS